MRFYQAIIILTGLVLLANFNSCGSQSSPFSNVSTLSACDPLDPNEIYNPNYVPNTNCTLPDSTTLMINPLGGSINVLAGQGDFNVSGTCNNGGFPSNVIVWQLMLNGVMVRSSGDIFEGQSWNTQCVDGQFIAYVYLVANPTGDDNDRTGLIDPSTGLQTSYTLQLTITGYDTNGIPYTNNVLGVRTVNLTPM